MIGQLLVGIVLVVTGAVLLWATHDRLRLLWRADEQGSSRRPWLAGLLQLLLSTPLAAVWVAGLLIGLFGLAVIVVSVVNGGSSS